MPYLLHLFLEYHPVSLTDFLTYMLLCCFYGHFSLFLVLPTHPLPAPPQCPLSPGQSQVATPQVVHSFPWPSGISLSQTSGYPSTSESLCSPSEDSPTDPFLKAIENEELSVKQIGVELEAPRQASTAESIITPFSFLTCKKEKTQALPFSPTHFPLATPTMSTSIHWKHFQTG